MGRGLHCVSERCNFCPKGINQGHSTEQSVVRLKREVDDMKQEKFDICVDDDKVEILDWIQSHFYNGNSHKLFEATVTLREINYVEENDDLKRVYID